MLFYILIVSAFAADGPANCKRAISENHCLECNEGYFLVIDDTTESGIPNLHCQKVDPIDNCQQYDGSACVRCEDTYYLSENQCLSCEYEDCVHCAIVDGEKICLECSGTLSIGVDEKSCVDCTNTDNNALCGRCGAGNYFNVTTKSCKPCMDHCSLCTEGYNCFQCTDNTLLTRQVGIDEEATSDKPDSCESISNCADGYLKPDHCELCIEGYTLKYGGCVKCPENCQTCYYTDYDKEDSRQCTTCTAEYMPKGGACVDPADHNCEEWSPTYGCLKCEDGFYFDDKYDCQPCDTTCKKCINSPTHCLECADKHYFSGTGENTICKSMAEACEL